jgi:hypothetical protein
MMIGTANDSKDEARMWLLVDRAVRTFAPNALEAAELQAEANKLRSLEPVTNETTAFGGGEAARAAWDAARAVEAAWGPAAWGPAAWAAAWGPAAWAAARAVEAARAARAAEAARAARAVEAAAEATWGPATWAAARAAEVARAAEAAWGPAAWAAARAAAWTAKAAWTAEAARAAAEMETIKVLQEICTL